jgi:hypothetical protein
VARRDGDGPARGSFASPPSRRCRAAQGPAKSTPVSKAASASRPGNVEAESGGLLIGDRVEITIDAELVYQPD